MTQQINSMRLNNICPHHPNERLKSESIWIIKLMRLTLNHSPHWLNLYPPTCHLN